MTQELNIKDFVNKDNTTIFQFYRQQHFYYRIRHIETHMNYIFPVPYEDIGTATLNSTEKSITLMRYLRKAISDKTIVLDIIKK